MVEMVVLEESYRAVADQVLPASEARATANEFILRNLGDRLGAGLPTLVTLPDHPVWAVPIVFRRTESDLIPAGELLVHALTGELLGSTTAREIDERVRGLLAS